MFPILIAMLFGGINGSLIEKQHAYCECYRSNFDGAYCQSIKADGAQGSCHK